MRMTPARGDDSSIVSIYLARGWRVLSLRVGWGGVDPVMKTKIEI